VEINRPLRFGCVLDLVTGPHRPPSKSHSARNRAVFLLRNWIWSTLHRTKITAHGLVKTGTPVGKPVHSAREVVRVPN
jgi:hypothetical protein